MNVSNNSDNYELDYYLSIIDFFQNQNTNKEKTEIRGSFHLTFLRLVYESKKLFQTK